MTFIAPRNASIVHASSFRTQLHHDLPTDHDRERHIHHHRYIGNRCSDGHDRQRHHDHRFIDCHVPRVTTNITLTTNVIMIVTRWIRFWYLLRDIFQKNQFEAVAILNAAAFVQLLMIMRVFARLGFSKVVGLRLCQLFRFCMQCARVCDDLFQSLVVEKIFFSLCVRQILPQFQ